MRAGCVSLVKEEHHALDKAARFLDTRQVDVGLRTVELVQDADSVGSSFYFRLNGVPVFMKGANLIPPDNFLPRADKATYERIVKDAADAHMNMLDGVSLLLAVALAMYLLVALLRADRS